jgi:phage terminase large subunit
MSLEQSIDASQLEQLENVLDRELKERNKLKWKPRDYQRPAWDFLCSGGKRAFLLWHRRSGKDELCLRFTLRALQERPGSYWHLLPVQEQSRRAIWRAVDPHTGKRRIDLAFPPVLRESTRDQEMLITFKNGSTWQVLGSDNHSSLVGSPPCGLVFSEWALSDPAAWSYLSPILEENQGWSVFNSTPRGVNHAKGMFEYASRSPDWFAQRLTANDTKLFTDKQLEKIEAEYLSLYGEDYGKCIYEQEYFCSFEAAVLGTFYGALMAQAEKEKRITGVPYDPSCRVVTAWDLGVADSTAIWFCQRVGKEIHLIDYYEASGVGLDHYAKIIHQRGYFYEKHVLPHDAEARELGTGKSRLAVLESLGLRRGVHGPVEIIPKEKVEEGIHAVRQLLPRCWFDANKCKKGVEALKLYRAEWNADKKVFGQKALHDWTSHPADALRYLALAIDGSSAGDAFHRKIVYKQGWIA